MRFGKIFPLGEAVQVAFLCCSQIPCTPALGLGAEQVTPAPGRAPGQELFVDKVTGKLFLLQERPERAILGFCATSASPKDS